MTEYCHCGSVEEAAKAAEKLFVQIAGTDCPVWAFQIAVIFRRLCINNLADAELTRSNLKDLANMILLDAEPHLLPTDELTAQTLARRTELYGEDHCHG
jgi:hypothetical protein